MKRINRAGVRPYSAEPVMPVAELTAPVILDLRPKEVFAENGSKGINVPYNKKFLSFAGWYLNYEEPLQLIGNFEVVQQAADELKLIGFDTVTGYLPGNKVNGPGYEQIESADFKRKDKEGINILDVRTQKEWDDSHFDGAKHLHFGKLLAEDIPFSQDDRIYVHCQSGVRSAIAMSILERLGYKQAINIKGGYEAVK